MHHAAKPMTLITRAICPVCESPGLDLQLAANPADGNLETAACTNCGIPFSVKADAATRDIRDLLPGPGCPECGHERAAFTMVCESPSRSSFLVVACESCGHPVSTALPAAATARRPVPS